MARCAAVPLLLGLIAAFAAVAVGVAPSGAGVIPSPTGTAALQGLWLREGAAERVGDVRGLVPALRCRRCSPQLYLRGAGDDDDEAGEADGGDDAVGMEDGEAGEDEEDSDAGPMTITKAIRQVRLPAPARCCICALCCCTKLRRGHMSAVWQRWKERKREPCC